MLFFVGALHVGHDFERESVLFRLIISDLFCKLLLRWFDGGQLSKDRIILFSDEFLKSVHNTFDNVLFVNRVGYSVYKNYLVNQLFMSVWLLRFAF